MLGLDSGCDLQSFLHGGQVASKANFGLWPLLMGLLEYFQICTQTIRKNAISNHFLPLGGAPALYYYFEFSECVRFSKITVPLYGPCTNTALVMVVMMMMMNISI